jgi:hypothetical protein
MKKLPMVASILLMGGGFANATEKITCLVRRLAVDFRNAEPVVLQRRWGEFYVFSDGQLILIASSVQINLLNQIRGNGNKNHSNVASFRRDNWCKVEYDRRECTRIGNISINFDSNIRKTNRFCSDVLQSFCFRTVGA